MTKKHRKQAMGRRAAAWREFQKTGAWPPKKQHVGKKERP